jgi:ribosomal protein L31
MKKNLHPTVRQTVFKDVSSDFSFLGTSTARSWYAASAKFPRNVTDTGMFNVKE